MNLYRTPLLLASSPSGAGIPPVLLAGVLAAASEPSRMTDAQALAAAQALDAKAARICRAVGDDLLGLLAQGIRSPRRAELWRAVEYAAAVEMRQRGLCLEHGGRECGAEECGR